ncbi:TadE family protein [Bacillus sp. FJAT-49736]|uniref:TadE family protein n=1 Tax=Bacillus sp. FJAT-49736 TaxID=2833582 RepID=UPI001BC8DA42|nr:TadE family protein [Bacillus sp. FJAT-49736]MBS4175854.1 pilus assembly protein [Bacillus sp. FJAT-49736]
MKIRKKYIGNEDGSATLEFIGMIPLVFIIVMVAWQLIVAVHSAVLAQSAANEAAKVYSLTTDPYDAEDSAKKIIDTSKNYLSMEETKIEDDDHHNAKDIKLKKFKATVKVNIQYIFLPKKLFKDGNTPSFSFTSSASGRTMD